MQSRRVAPMIEPMTAPAIAALLGCEALEFEIRFWLDVVFCEGVPVDVGRLISL